MKSGMIAIDLGSSNTAIYQSGQGVVLYEPSVVALSAGEKRSVKEVGKTAKAQLGRASGNTVVVSPVFESEIEDMQAATAMLENFLNKITLKRLSARPAAVFSVPCGAEQATVRKFERLLQNVGVSDYSLVESPVLSAIGLQIPLSVSSPRFIINIGGGTTEIAAVSLDGVICGISVNMGGLSLDAMLKSYVEEHFGLIIGSLTAERMKIQIGSLASGDTSNTVISGRDVTSGRPVSAALTSMDVLEPIKIFFNKILQITGMVLSKLPAEVSADIRRNGLYFVGGGAKIVGLDEYCKSVLGIRANVPDNPEMRTVLGGGMLAADGALLKRLRLNKR